MRHSVTRYEMKYEIRNDQRELHRSKVMKWTFNTIKLKPCSPILSEYVRYFRIHILILFICHHRLIYRTFCSWKHNTHVCFYGCLFWLLNEKRRYYIFKCQQHGRRSLNFVFLMILNWILSHFLWFFWWFETRTDFWFYIVIINACADPMVRSHIETWHHRSVLQRHNSRFWCRTAFVQRRSQNQQKLKVPGCPFKNSSGVKLWRRRGGTDTGLLHCIDPVMYWSDCNWSLSRRRRRCFPLTLKAE